MVVSKLYGKVGDQIRAGQVLVEVSGRPIIALSGAVPAYRDLKPGMDGPDIAQLQAALKQLGHDCAPDGAGHFGPGTKGALTALYTHLGYPVPTTGGANGSDDKAALQGAADAVTAQQRAVDTAHSMLQKANQALAAAKNGSSQPSTPPEIGASPSLPAAQTALQAARDAQRAAQTTYNNALEDLEKAGQKQRDLIAATGPMLPASEVVFVPSFPIRLAKLNATLGSTVAGTLLTLESGQLVVTSALQPGQDTLVKPGTKVHLTAEALGGQTATGTVTLIGQYNDGSTPGGQSADGQNSGTNGASGTNGGQTTGTSGSGNPQTPRLPGYPMTVTPDSPLPAAWAGQDVRVTIVNAATSGAVLAVPLSAVSTGADGQSTLTVLAADGTQRRIPVTAGASADGDVEVTPVGADLLHQGDAVVIGQAQR
ncbi:peptidoglycan-binding protein [Catenulispora yoronensis]